MAEIIPFPRRPTALPGGAIADGPVIAMRRYSSMRYEGSKDALVAAGVLHPDDRVPERPNGFCRQERGGYFGGCICKVSMLRDGRLRVFRCREHAVESFQSFLSKRRMALVAAAQSDPAFQRFILRLVNKNSKT